MWQSEHPSPHNLSARDTGIYYANIHSARPTRTHAHAGRGGAGEREKGVCVCGDAHSTGLRRSTTCRCTMVALSYCTLYEHTPHTPKTDGVCQVNTAGQQRRRAHPAPFNWCCDRFCTCQRFAAVGHLNTRTNRITSYASCITDSVRVRQPATMHWLCSARYKARNGNMTTC